MMKLRPRDVKCLILIMWLCWSKRGPSSPKDQISTPLPLGGQLQRLALCLLSHLMWSSIVSDFSWPSFGLKPFHCKDFQVSKFWCIRNRNSQQSFPISHDKLFEKLIHGPVCYWLFRDWLTHLRITQALYCFPFSPWVLSMAISLFKLFYLK